MEFDRCRDILLREGELVRMIGGLQSTIHNAIVSRDWTDFEEHFDALDGLGKELAALEGERERLFPKGDAGDPSGFYAFAARLPEGERKEITEAYRKLKVETLRVKAAGETLMGYIAGARATMAGFFEAAFPGRSGQTYSRGGGRAAGDMRSMVLNQRF